MSYPKFRAVREERVVRAAKKRDIEEMSLQECLEELSELEVEKEEDLASFYNMIDKDDHDRSIEKHIERMFAADHSSRGLAEYHEDADFRSIDDWC